MIKNESPYCESQMLMFCKIVICTFASKEFGNIIHTLLIYVELEKNNEEGIPIHS